ncbi:hypothetical protein F0562_019516 [Nyssa sinensis]|uniref:Uncharacterized protein n=1 Tax=Nyssa sinensis TaxID=561372 RepID=A0A5J5BRT5_9ASTE|nr:hypothetical protein F0562_019516 [Nyssa sinensis]
MGTPVACDWVYEAHGSFEIQRGLGFGLGHERKDCFSKVINRRVEMGSGLGPCKEVDHNRAHGRQAELGLNLSKACSHVTDGSGPDIATTPGNISPIIPSSGKHTTVESAGKMIRSVVLEESSKGDGMHQNYQGQETEEPESRMGDFPDEHQVGAGITGDVQEDGRSQGDIVRGFAWLAELWLHLLEGPDLDMSSSFTCAPLAIVNPVDPLDIVDLVDPLAVFDQTEEVMKNGVCKQVWRLGDRNEVLQQKGEGVQDELDFREVAWSVWGGRRV